MKRNWFALKAAGLVLGTIMMTILPGYGQATGVSRNADRRAQPKPSFKVSRTLSSNHYSSLRLARKEVVSVGVDTLYIDTLVMDDKSMLFFLEDTRMRIGHAVIGSQCTFLAAGQSGRQPGSSGEDGRNLEVHMILYALGDLVIDTRGGHGATGLTGTAGESTLGYQGMGGAGGPGGNGGLGGALRLFYRGEGFLPVFNGEGRHIITLHYQGGKAGSGGPGGKGGRKLVTDGNGKTTICGSCPPGPSGPSGPGGVPGADGELRLERISH